MSLSAPEIDSFSAVRLAVYWCVAIHIRLFRWSKQGIKIRFDGCNNAVAGRMDTVGPGDCADTGHTP